MPSVGVRGLGPERGDFDFEAVEEDRYGAVPYAGRDHAPIGAHDLLGARIGGDVEVAYFAAEEVVAKGAAYEVAGLARVAKDARELEELPRRSYRGHR